MKDKKKERKESKKKGGERRGKEVRGMDSCDVGDGGVDVRENRSTGGKKI